MHIPWDLTVERTILQILFRLLGHKCTKRCVEFPPTAGCFELLYALRIELGLGDSASLASIFFLSVPLPTLGTLDDYGMGD